MLRLAETVGVSEPVFAPVLAARTADSVRLREAPARAGCARRNSGAQAPWRRAAAQKLLHPALLHLSTPPPPNWRNPDRLREVGGGGCVPGHCPAPQVCFGHSCQVRTRRRGPVWGQPPAPPPSGKHPQQLFFSSFNFVNGPKDPICRPRLSLTGKSWVL